jgi:hypothetical protein
MFYILLLIVAIIVFYLIAFKLKGKKRIWVLALSVIPLLFLHTCSGGIISPIPFRYMAGFSGKVIDADTKEPIVGAAVLAVYYKSVSTVAGSNSYAVDGQETLTDKNGEFEISWSMGWFVLNRGYAEGNINIFKPGYGVFPDYEGAIAVGVNETWPPPNRYIVYELPKLKTRKERKDNLIFSRPDIPYKKMRNFINLINEEYSTLGLPGVSIPKEEK